MVTIKRLFTCIWCGDSILSTIPFFRFWFIHCSPRIAVFLWPHIQRVCATASGARARKRWTYFEKPSQLLYRIFVFRRRRAVAVANCSIRFAVIARRLCWCYFVSASVFNFFFSLCASSPLLSLSSSFQCVNHTSRTDELSTSGCTDSPRLIQRKI